MSMGDIVPTVPLGGNGNGNGGWGDAVGAFAGALFGSWFGNGWGGNGYGGGRSGGEPTVIVAGGAGSGCGGSSAELDALSGIQSGLNGLGLQTLQGQNAANMAMCQGFSGVVAADNANTASLMNAVTQGFAGLNNAEQVGNAAIQQTLCQGFSGVNTAIMGAAKDAALQSCQDTGAITKAISDCCCNTQKTIMAEGQATRDLISHYAYENLQTKVCDLKAENSALKAQQFTAAALAGQTAQLIGALRPATGAAA